MLNNSSQLPIPSAEATQHSNRLIERIKAEIQAQGGMIDFSRYMQMALYDPGLGYYSAGLKKFGKEGDFVTAPEISPLFSRCLAKQCAQVLKQIDNGCILEFGAGSGAMAAEILSSLEQLKCLPKNYFILEVSADLRARQQQYIEQRIPHFKNKVIWLNELPKEFSGIVLANEVLDAMPVHKFRIDSSAIHEFFVTYKNDGFHWEIKPCENAQVIKAIGELNITPTTAYYDSEINLAVMAWLKSISEFLQKGLLLIIDYGFPRHEYYHLDRHMGTLMCHYRHYAHPDPLILTGLQDITAHVDFTAVAEAGFDSGMKIAGFASQATFLLSCGLLELKNVDALKEPSQQIALSQEIQLLTAPHEMGELFKVIALSRGLEGDLIGFSMQNQRHRL